MLYVLSPAPGSAHPIWANEDCRDEHETRGRAGKRMSPVLAFDGACCEPRLGHVPSQASPVRSSPATQPSGLLVIPRGPSLSRRISRRRRNATGQSSGCASRQQTSPRRIGERVQFAATAEDGDGRPVGGVAVSWRASGSSAPSDLPITDDGSSPPPCAARTASSQRARASGRRRSSRWCQPSEPVSAALASSTSGGRARVMPAAPGVHPGLLPPREPTWVSRVADGRQRPDNRRGANPLDEGRPLRVCRGGRGR